MTLGVVLMLAGQSSRMGRMKALLPWRNRLNVQLVEGRVLGSSRLLLIDSICQALRGLGAHVPIVAVVGPSLRDDVIDEEVFQLRGRLGRYDIECIENLEPQEGQGHSLSLGVGALLDDHCVDGIVCCVGDQPLLNVETMQTLAAVFEEAWQEDSQAIVVPRYQPHGQAGNPVIFSRSWACDLQVLTGEQGGRTVWQNQGLDHVVYAEVPDFHGLSRGLDVDTPDMYEELISLVNEENG